MALTNPLAQSSQAGLAPTGDSAQIAAIRRLQKLQARQSAQTPGKIQPPSRPMPMGKY